MRSKTLVPMIVAAALGAPALVAAQQTVYRWVDKDGKVQFSDTPPNEEAKGLTQKTVGRGPGDASQLPFATQVAMRKNPVTLYTGRDCTDGCEKGRNLLTKRGIPYSERDAQANQESADALKKLIDDLYVPTLVVGGNALKGFSEGAWNSALDSAGYPSGVLPGQIPPKPPEPVKKAPEGTAAGTAAAEAPEATPELTTQRR